MLDSVIRTNKSIILKHFWKKYKITRTKTEKLINDDLDSSSSDESDSESDNESNNY